MIVFLLSHQPNPRFVKQICYLSKNNSVGIINYRREGLKDLSNEYIANVKFYKEMSCINNGFYLGRLKRYIIDIVALKKYLKKYQPNCILVNNFDTLFLGLVASFLSRIKPNFVVEISDMRDHCYRSSLKNIILRRIEKFLFKWVKGLIITSPKFYSLYYNSIFDKQYFVLENKPLSFHIPPPIVQDKKPSNKKIIIGIVGLLLQGELYRFLFDVFKEDERVEIHIHGKGVFEYLAKEYAARYRNIKFFGEYNLFKDSAKIYCSLDILFMQYDTENGSLNNKVALPNKFYEAMYYKVPVITSSGTYLGERVAKLQLGYVVTCFDKQALKVCIEEWDKKKEVFLKSLAELDRELFLADNDYRNLEKYLESLRDL